MPFFVLKESKQIEKKKPRKVRGISNRNEQREMLAHFTERTGVPSEYAYEEDLILLEGWQNWLLQRSLKPSDPNLL